MLAQGVVRLALVADVSYMVDGVIIHMRGMGRVFHRMQPADEAQHGLAHQSEQQQRESEGSRQAVAA